MKEPPDLESSGIVHMEKDNMSRFWGATKSFDILTKEINYIEIYDSDARDKSNVDRIAYKQLTVSGNIDKGICRKVCNTNRKELVDYFGIDFYDRGGVFHPYDKGHNVLVPGLAMDPEGNKKGVPVNAKASEFEAVPAAGMTAGSVKFRPGAAHKCTSPSYARLRTFERGGTQF